MDVYKHGAFFPQKMQLINLLHYLSQLNIILPLAPLSAIQFKFPAFPAPHRWKLCKKGSRTPPVIDRFPPRRVWQTRPITSTHIPLH